MRMHGNRLITTDLEAKFVGRNGILVQADCLDLLANLNTDSIDLVFVDPPFNLGKSYNIPEFSDSFDTEFYKGLCKTWLLQCIRVLRPGGALFIYHLPKWLIDLGAWLNSLQAVEYKAWIALKMKNGFPIKGRIHPAHYGLLYYVKTGGVPTFNVVRQRSPKCRKCGELVRDYGGYLEKYTKYKFEGDIWVQVSDFWEDTRPASHDKLRENTVNELPLQVPERAVLIASRPGDVVLDCFSGGGSALHAAEKHARQWIAVDSENCRASLERIKAFLDCDETQRPSKRVRQCFSSDFVKAALTINPRAKSRPIKEVRVKTNTAGDKFRSKSMVFAEPRKSISKRPGANLPRNGSEPMKNGKKSGRFVALARLGR